MDRADHPACPGGCGELADECTCSRSAWLGSMRMTDPDGCCTCCDGSGATNQPDTGGKCWDCQGTGHSHDAATSCVRLVWIRHDGAVQ